MKYELLDPDNWHELTELMEDNPLPSPMHAAIAVARDDTGEIRGLLMLQYQLHMEPLVLKDPHVNFLKLVDTLEKKLKENGGGHYFAFSPNERMDRIAYLAGFNKEKTWSVFHKEV